jgi:hypothetical protein
MRYSIAGRQFTTVDQPTACFGAGADILEIPSQVKRFFPLQRNYKRADSTRKKTFFKAEKSRETGQSHVAITLGFATRLTGV